LVEYEQRIIFTNHIYSAFIGRCYLQLDGLFCSEPFLFNSEANHNNKGITGICFCRRLSCSAANGGHTCHALLFCIILYYPSRPISSYSVAHLLADSLFAKYYNWRNLVHFVDFAVSVQKQK
jgi:hypothetical protein